MTLQKNKTVLVTGGAGFIGSHLCENLLKNKCKVICLDNFNNFYNPIIKVNNIKEVINLIDEKVITPEQLVGNLNSYPNKDFKLYYGDIRDSQILDEIFKEHKIEIVFHLAAMAGVRPSIEEPLLYEEVNSKGTINLLETMKKYNVIKGIFASSSSVYGNNKSVPFKETDIVDKAISPYAATKKANEVIAHVYHSLYDLNIIMLRFFTVYGPRQRPDLAIHKFTSLMLNQKPIPFYGDGTTRRDYTFIDDIIEGVMSSFKYLNNHKYVYEIINLGEHQTISLKEMVTTLEDELRLKAELNKMPMLAGDTKQTYADIEKAKNLLQYNPSTEFKEGIKKFIRWYKENN